MRSENEFLIDTLDRLNRSGVDYMLTGSMVTNYWGIPRTTHDLDFVLMMVANQVDRFVECFSSGMFIQPESVRSFFQPPHQFNVLDEQSALKADFWLLRDEPFEHSAFRRRVSVTLFETAAWIATAEDIIISKLLWNRLTGSEWQLQDIAGVYAVQGEVLDMAYLRHWAAVLSLEQEVEDMATGKLKPKST